MTRARAMDDGTEQKRGSPVFVCLFVSNDVIVIVIERQKKNDVLLCLTPFLTLTYDTVN